MRLGIALSGGGLRASLFHLGVMRFLRDAGLLHLVSDIVTVSGGSITGAHMGLHWNQYVGEDKQFQEAAEELIRFAKANVRGKILRRLPLCLLAKAIPRYEYGRVKLLQHYYSKYLYKENSLERLMKDGPRLHIMTTNLSTGFSCSFNQEGLSVDYGKGHKDLRAADMKLSLAVACSSAFPGFFPPVHISSKDLGTKQINWNPDPQAFTDGGVLDNLGIRKLKSIDDASYEEIYFTESTIGAWIKFCGWIFQSSKKVGPANAIYRNLSSNVIGVIESVSRRGEIAAVEKQQILNGLNDILKNKEFYDSADWEGISIPDKLSICIAQGLKSLPEETITAFNRELMEFAFPEYFRSVDLPFDYLITSDAGAPFDWTTMRFEGLLGTALRAVNVTMNRIHGLEKERIEEGKCLQIAIDDEVYDPKDAKTISPNIRRRLYNIRTDLDAFSNTEIRALVLHGYCLARKKISEHQLKEKIDQAIFEKPPWDPIPSENTNLVKPEAGELVKSSHVRRVDPLTKLSYGLVVVLVFSLVGIGFYTGLLPSLWQWLFSKHSVHVSRQVVYAKILRFEDRREPSSTAREELVGMEGTAVRREKRRVYDEGQYLISYYLKDHQVEDMDLHCSSSGICTVTPIIPSSITVMPEAIEEYERVDGSRLDYRVPLVNSNNNEYRDYVTVSLSFYNGYQYNEKKKRWESDGGVHVHYPTDELIMVFDFKDIYPGTLLHSKPIMKVKRAGEEKGVPWEAARYDNGVLYSGPIRNLPAGSSVHVDWEWAVEKKKFP